MAVMLIKKGDNGVIKDGTVLAVKQDDWIWGKAENDTTLFVKITVPNAPIANFTYLEESLHTDEHELVHYRKQTINYTDIADINNSTLDEIQLNLTVR
jgi:hypothetical protein